MLNQRLDLLQEEIDILMDSSALSCLQNLPGLCITSMHYDSISRAADFSRQSGAMLNGTWNVNFQNLTNLLRQQIVTLNSTKVSLLMVSSVVQFFPSMAWYRGILYPPPSACGRLFMVNHYG
ncbi:hypothetical protein H1C71_012229 [Ictidomys tridecemlineatus]|nr:hypothetical protein H1C71_012229 [Ictidomys tridecemlineatus]